MKRKFNKNHNQQKGRVNKNKDFARFHSRWQGPLCLAIQKLNG